MARAVLLFIWYPPLIRFSCTLLNVCHRVLALSASLLGFKISMISYSSGVLSVEILNFNASVANCLLSKLLISLPAHLDIVPTVLFMMLIFSSIFSFKLSKVNLVCLSLKPPKSWVLSTNPFSHTNLNRPASNCSGFVPSCELITTISGLASTPPFSSLM
jgi:hypothetical protein